ncbi:recombination protein NinG [Pseudomonas fluorescens]|uniref:NinG protein n=2 Tax=Pseudomonas fluorescens group TaxID=136843 RepID=A0A2N1E306_PSEFL|nr:MULTISPECIES: recombination protein NinG [Pseudomonas fluorescens group]AUZ46559.1 ninG protein [Pseudomonas orientalis]MBD8099820.1 recombination protein NinG [Pseudomonas fluorescens]MBD8774257.1 recombination protein NinG [Pseudomonas fluorescens]MBD8781319.1 recombination protein NinG [Pseudomonas fluorescens]MBD8796588.1 recombination protein NinG [Pseudomonas fluorescens]
MIAKQPKPKKCKNPACGISFPPQRLGQAVCSPKCGLAIKDVNQAKARKSLAQVNRREIKVRKEKLKSRADHLREAQAAVNAYVRLRDAYLPCISCDSAPNDNDLMTGSRWDAGHYRSVGACPELRFEPLNIHRQCVKCNRNLSGNAVEYRIRLVVRIGAEKVAWLEGQHAPCKYTVEEIKAIKAKYRAMTRELKKGEAA